jgi:hypothetical protein
MGLRLSCDGCDCALDATTAKSRGRLARVFYCETCGAAVDAAEGAIEAERVRLVTAFEAFRADRLARLRQTVKALPDE